MAQSNTPITKTDLNVAIASIRELIQNELKHHAQDIGELKSWRNQFIAEGGPWRTMDNRVKALEYLARNIKGVIAALMPIAIWATIEIIKAIVAWARGG